MSRIPNTTRELQDIGDKAAIADYETMRAKHVADVEAAQAALEKTDDDESEMWAAHALTQALLTLAHHTARYRRAVHRQARRERESKKAMNVLRGG